MSRLTRWMDASWYPTHGNNWDDALFRQRVLKYLSAQTRCLDYGSGRGKVAQMNFKGIAGFMAGVDPEAAVFDNPFLDHAALLDLANNHIPHPDASFDVVFADNVMEHVEYPTAVLTEIARVLKPGGRLLVKTPNKWHYMPSIARFTPTWFHRFYNRMRGRKGTDTFPTQYRINTAADVRTHAAASGMRVHDISFIEGRPEYLRLFALTYLAGFIYERTVNAWPFLRPLRCVLVFELERPP